VKILERVRDFLRTLSESVEKGEVGRSLVRLLADSALGPSDVDLRVKLDEVLRAEPGFLSVDSLFPEDGVVIYAVTTGADDLGALLFMQRSYAIGGDGTVSLSGPAVEVRPVTRFEPVKAEPTVAAAAGHVSDSESTPAVEETTLADKKARIRALIASGRLCHFVESDIEVLAGMSEERLAALEALPVPVPPKPKTPEEFLEEAPDVIKQIVADHRAAQEKRREELLTSVRALNQNVYSEQDLQSMETSALEKVVRLAASIKPTVDQSGRALPRAASGSDNEVPDAPRLVDVSRAKK